ncbi:MAG: flavodoxin domain-containing protein [Bacteroidales bacterium]
MMKILVTYAGGAGPSAGVAERIARVMTGLGADVTLLPMTGVSTIKGFSAVIAGSIERGGGWVPEAMEFVRRNQALLNKKLFAIFTVIPSLALEKGAESRMVIMQYTAHVRGMVHPVGEGFFSGETESRKETPPGERSKFKLRILLGLLREGDRSHGEIETWAAKLHEKLLQAAGKAAKSPVHGI